MERKAKSYLTALFALVLGLLVSTLVINCIADPLWYFRGNLITGKNFAFDERLSKTNLFLNQAEEYDCFIFGDSRLRLLDASKIEGYNCFNFAFGMGQIAEFVAYAAYLKALGYCPKLTIIAVNGFNFFIPDHVKEIPDFVINRTRPRSFWVNYLTLDVLGFSLRALLGLSPSPEYYRSDFSPGTLSGVAPYKPKSVENTVADTSLMSKQGFLEKTKAYKQIMRIFRGSEFIFYAPPVSVWRVGELIKHGALDTYLKGIYHISQIAPVVYDFSIPSNITRDITRSYDGSHYDSRTNGLIAESISSGIPKFGVRVQAKSYADYKKQYLDRYRKFMSVARRASGLPAPSAGEKQASTVTWPNGRGATSTAATSSPARMHSRRACRAQSTACDK